MSVVLSGRKNLAEPINLASLACSAAEELDLIAQGQPSDTKHVQVLSQFLNDAATSAKNPSYRAEGAIRLMMVQRALADAALPVEGLRTVDDLIAEALRLSAKLGSDDSPQNQSAKMRDFCLALSRVAVAQGQSLLESDNYGPGG